MKDIQSIYADRRRKNEYDKEKRVQEVYDKIPKFKEIEQEIKEKNILRIQLAIDNSSKKEIEKITKRIELLNNKKNNLLKKNNFPLDYMEMRYHCNICKDTGIDGTKTCVCKKQLLTRKMYEESGIEESLQRQNFENFNLDLFRKNRQSDEDISPYEEMKILKDWFYNYAHYFNIESPDIFLHGPVGTGKTYLLNSIAKEVIDKGFSVVYFTESDLVNNILEYRFAYSEQKSILRPKLDFIYNSDLLIIDDLGTTNINETTISAIYDVINARLVKRKTVIISSNYDMMQIKDLYNERIYSRISGFYEDIETFGNDVRQRNF